MLIDDFANGAQDRWRLVTDQVMGGVSKGRATWGDDPPHIHLTGAVSTENNGGFIQVRRDLSPWPRETRSVVLTVMGDEQTYYMALRTSDATRPWHSYRAPFRAPRDWTAVQISIAEFLPSRADLPPLDLTRLKSIGILAYGRDHEADLRVARLAISA